MPRFLTPPRPHHAAAIGLAILVGALPTRPAWAETPELHLFGGDNHKTFLGCLNCPKHDMDSVCSDYGVHGSRYASESIWNPYGKYASVHSYHSVWNTAAWDAPLIRDGEGNFYGYFTARKRLPERTRIRSLLVLLDHPEEFAESPKQAKKHFCAVVKRSDPGYAKPLRKLDEDPLLTPLTPSIEDL